MFHYNAQNEKVKSDELKENFDVKEKIGVGAGVAGLVVLALVASWLAYRKWFSNGKIPSSSSGDKADFAFRFY